MDKSKRNATECGARLRPDALSPKRPEGLARFARLFYRWRRVWRWQVVDCRRWPATLARSVRMDGDTDMNYSEHARRLRLPLPLRF